MQTGNRVLAEKNLKESSESCEKCRANHIIKRNQYLNLACLPESSGHTRAFFAHHTQPVRARIYCVGTIASMGEGYCLSSQIAKMVLSGRGFIFTKNHWGWSINPSLAREPVPNALLMDLRPLRPVILDKMAVSKRTIFQLTLSFLLHHEQFWKIENNIEEQVQRGSNCIYSGRDKIRCAGRQVMP
jgi:hypothetical protein